MNIVYTGMHDAYTSIGVLERAIPYGIHGFISVRLGLALTMAVVLSGDECLLAVSRTIEMYNCGNAKEAKRELVIVKQQGKALIKKSETLSRRLEGLQPFALQRQEEIAREITQQQEKERNLQRQIDDMAIKLSRQESDLNYQSQCLQKAEREERSARREREEAEAKMNELKLLWWVPGYGQYLAIRELVENNSDKEREAARRLRDHLSKQRSIQGTISDIRSTIDRNRRERDWITARIRELKTKQKESYDILSEIRIATETLLSSTYFWKELVAAAEHGETRSDTLMKIVEKAYAFGDGSVLERRGSQTQARSFIEAWRSVQDMLTQGAEHALRFKFKCCRCGGEFVGLPWPQDDSASVVCDSCHI